MTYGPSYRIPNKIIWNNVVNEVNNSINDCIIKWSKKQHVDEKIFYECRDVMIKNIRSQIGFFKMNPANNNDVNVLKNNQSINCITQITSKR